MAQAENHLIGLSDNMAQLVERAAGTVVAVHGRGHRSSSGIHWRSGVVVTAEECVDRDESITLTLPGGRVAEASFAGRDPTTDVAVFRFQPDGLPAATTVDAIPSAGHLVLAVGNYEGAPLAQLGIVAYANGVWHSRRGGKIDRLVRLDLELNPRAEGGAVLDVQGRVIGMAVLGPRRRVLAIPSATIDRAVDQLLARGQVFRGYLGAGLQALTQHDHHHGRHRHRRHHQNHQRHQQADALQTPTSGVLVVSVDPNGPSARAGILVGDIVTAWNGNPIGRVREVMRLLGPESVGSTIDLALIRAGSATETKVVIGERPVG
ncbi:MAG TPA: S1C family serine protease [Xanthobacteraceae bacterium]|jgi:S1-C subfamily serine protease